MYKNQSSFSFNGLTSIEGKVPSNQIIILKLKVLKDYSTC